VSGEPGAGRAPAPGRRGKGRRRAPRANPDRLLTGYLERRPAADPRVLLPRSILPLARAALLADGVLRHGWAVTWLVAFLFAEIFLLIRLTALGDRLSGGPPLDPRARRQGALARDLVWLVVALAATWTAGVALELGAGAAGGFAAGTAWWSRPGWGVLAYVGLLGVDFVRDVAAARASGKGFVSAAAVSAAFLVVAFVLSLFALVPLVAFSASLSSEGPRLAVAGLLVVVRAAAELAVLWLPVWAPGRLFPRGPDPAG